MSVKIEVDLNTKEAQDQINKLSAQWEKANLKVDRQKQKVEELNKELEEHNKLLDYLKKSGQNISNDEWAKELKMRLKEANAELKLLQANADIAGDKLKKAIAPKTPSIQSSIIPDIGTKFIDNLKSKMSDFKNISSKFGDNLKSKISSLIPDFGKLGNAITHVGSRILKLAQYTFVFSVITKGFRAIRRAAIDYINTSYELTSSLAQVRGNLITAFQPIWEFILPYLIKFTQWLANATAYISSFISSLFGKTEQSSRNNARALQEQIALSKESSKSLKKQKKNTDDLTKSNKKNAASLAKFDELILLSKNRISKKSKSTETPTAGIPSTISFDTSNIDTSGISNLVKKIKEFFLPLQEPFDKLMKSLDRLKGYTFEAFTDFYNLFLKPLSEYTVNTFLPHLLNSIADSLDRMDFSTVNQGLSDLWTELEPFTENIGEGILWFIDKFLLPISEWTVNTALPEFLKTLTKSVKSLNSALEILKPLANEIYKEIVVPLGNYLNTAFKTAMDTLNYSLDDLNNFLVDNKDEIEKFSNTIINILGGAVNIAVFFLNNLVTRWKNMFNAIKDFMFDWINNTMKLFNGLVDFISGIFTWNFERAFKGLANAIIAVINNLANKLDLGISLIINFMAEKINSLIDIINSIGSFTGIHIPHAQTRISYVGRIPYLASGAVIPPNSPFLAMLGDQKSGVNIETPLETMKQAFKEALAESGSTNNGGSYTFVAQLDGRTLFEETVRQNDMYVNQSGYSAFSY